MADNLSPEDRLKTMRAVKGKDTGLERRLFAMLAGMRLKGWHRHGVELPGKPDVVFPEARIVIFADGCFWHKCPICNRKLPLSNREYWESKIRRNAERDIENTRRLQEQGWYVLRIWEHELKDGKLRRNIQMRIRAQTKEKKGDPGSPASK